MKKLQELLLDGTGEEGGLEPLADLTELQQLYLSATIQELWLDGAEVEGGLEPLADLTELKQLYLSGTKIGGGLEPLRYMKKL